MDKRVAAVVLVCVLMVLGSASAQDSWVGGNSNWSNGGYWSSGVPTSSSDVVIASGSYDAVILDAGTARVNSLDLGGNYGISFLVDNGTAQSLTITKALNIGGTGILGLTGTSTLNLNGGAPSTNIGQLLMNNASAVLNNSGVFTNYNLVQSAGGLNNFGALLNLGALVTTGTLYNNNTAFLRNESGGDLENNAVLNNDGAVINVGILNNNSGAMFTNTIVGHLENALRLNNRGTLLNNNTLFNDSNATLTNESGGFLGNNALLNNLGGTLNNAGALNNNGTLNNIGGILNNAGFLDNQSSATLNNYSNATLNNSGAVTNEFIGTLNNAGALNNSAGGDLENDGVLNNTGILTNNGTLNNFLGRLNNSSTVSNAGQILISPFGSLYNTGPYTQTAGSTVVDGFFSSATAIQIMGGTLSGRGTIQGDVSMGGTMSPGDSPGTLTLNGNYTQLATGTFFAELAGLVPGTQYDQLVISGTATLAGTLEVALLNSFTVQLGDTFYLMTFSSETGQFSISDLPKLPSGEYWAVYYDPTDLRLQVAPTPEPGTLLMLGSSALGVAGLLRRKVIG